MSTIPSMGATNPWETVQRVLIGIQQQIDQIRSSMGAFENASIGKGGLTLTDSGALTMLDEAQQTLTRMAGGAASYFDPATGGRVTIYKGRLYFWDLDGDEGDVSRAGQIMVDQGAGRNVMRQFPPHETGSGLETSFTMRGQSADQTGNIWAYTDGSFQVAADQSHIVQASAITFNTTGNEFGLYGLPTTSSGANIFLGSIGGKWTLGYVTSSRRYKQDIADAPINPQAALSWRPRTWRDKNEVAAIGDAARTHIGFIAEEVDAVSPEFVLRDDQDRADSLAYDRMVAGVVSTVQAQEKRAAEDRAKTVALEAKVGALQGKVDAQSQENAALKDANTALGLRVAKTEAALKKLGVAL